MKKRRYMLVGILFGVMTLFGCANDKDIQPVFGEKNKAYEGFTYLEGAVLEDEQTSRDTVVYLLKSTDSYVIDNKSFSSNNGLSLSMELNSITFDETKTVKDNLSIAVEEKSKELNENKSNTAYALEQKDVWADETKAIIVMDYIWHNAVRDEQTYKKHYYCLWQLDDKNHALMEVKITENEIGDPTVLENVLKEIETYYGVHIEYEQETITAKKEAYQEELKKIKEEEEYAKLKHEQGNYTFCLPEGYDMQLSYDDAGMVMYDRNDEDFFMFMDSQIEMAKDEVTDFEQLDEEELNRMMEEELKKQAGVDNMEFEKIENDVFGMVLKSEIEMSEGNKKSYGVMFIAVKERNMIMAITSSFEKEAANECAQMFIDSIKEKE